MQAALLGHPTTPSEEPAILGRTSSAHFWGRDYLAGDLHEVVGRPYRARDEFKPPALL